MLDRHTALGDDVGMLRHAVRHSLVLAARYEAKAAARAA